MTQIWRTLAVVGTVGAASVALADEPVKIGDRKLGATTSNVVTAPVTGKAPAPAPKGPDHSVFTPGLRGPGPVNDLCVNALPIMPGGSVAGDTTGGFPDAEANVCGAGGMASASVWYTFTGTGASMNASLCGGASWDTYLHVFSGSCGGLTCVAWNDDFCGLQSQTGTFLTTEGTQYYIYVSAWSAAGAGPFTLTLNDLGVPPPPGPGDDCASAFVRTVPFTDSGDTTFANPNFGLPACGTGDASPSHWYQITGTGNQIRATTCNGTFYDSALSVFTGDCSFLSCVTSNDDSQCNGSFTLQSTVLFQTNPGQTYYIVVRGFSTSFGPYTLEVSEILPPANDECANATLVSCNSGPVSANNLGATDNFIDDVYLCRVGGGVGTASVWFRFVATDDSAVVATCDSPAADSIIQVFQGSCGNLDPLPDGCNDDGCNGLRSRAIVRNLIPGNTYYVMVSAWSAANMGEYTLSVTCPAPPPAPGDDCAQALEFGAIPGMAFGDTSTANPDSVDTCGGPGAAAPGVWYRVVAPAGVERLRAETCGSSYDTVLRVYNGPCDFLSCVTFNDDAICNGVGTLQSRVIWDVTPGTEYFVYVGGFGSGSGAYTLSIDEPPPPCMIVPPGGASMENETDCGVPVDTVNGGCNSSPNVFGSIQCNVPIYGTAAFDGFTRDTDWFQFTVTEPGEFTFTVRSEFLALAGFIGVNTANPTGECFEMTGFVSPAMFPADDCEEYSVTSFLEPGVWTVFVAPQFLNPFNCGSTGSSYLAVLTGACGPGEDDCNNNGIPDTQEIAGGARDCFNPLVGGIPPTAGGSDGFLDECQCVANWNRDGAVNSNDISSYLSSWLNAIGGGFAVADINCDGLTNSNDISAFLSTWLSAVQNTIPHDGCP